MPSRILAALAAMVLTSATAACGGSDTTPPAPVKTDLSPLTPTAGAQIDKITWNLPSGEPSTLDPAKVGDYSPNTVEANLCDSLLRLKPDYSTGPGLARAYKWVGAKTLVFDLRDDVKFWDGSPLNADDVVYSLKRQMDPATEAVNVGAFASVASISKTGPLQVTVRFKYPDELFLKLMSVEVGAVSKAAAVRKAGKDYGSVSGGLMCTGPFKLGAWKSGDSISLERNDAYWDSTLKPKTGRVVFKFVGDANTLSSALLSGEIDGSYEIPPATQTAVAKAGTGKIYYGPSTQTVLLAPVKGGAGADRRICDALGLILDRAALVKNVFGGAAEVSRTFIPPAVWQGSEAKNTFQEGYDALPLVTTVDPAKAKQLVAEANPKSTVISIATQAGDQQGLQILTYLQAGAKQIGLDVQIKQVQPTQFSNLFYDEDQRKGYDFVYAQGYVEVPDPLSYAPLIANPDGLFNWTGYSDPTVTKALAQAQRTLDPVASAKLFNAAQARYTTGLPAVGLVFPYERLFMNKRISGAPASFAYINLPWAAMIGGTGK
jgi:peptide/nickel transport system substrate-binding protein